MYKRNIKNLPISEVYRNLFPWQSLNQFVDTIKDTIAYRSEDNSVIALCKPFGVGTFHAYDKNSNKQNQDKILSNLDGSCRYCMSDILKPLSDEFSPEKPYQILKSIDRYLSGLILITNDPNTYKPRFIKAIANSKINTTPPYGFRAITCGYPILSKDKIQEIVGIQLVEVDELGDFKEPIIIQNPSKKFKNKYSKDLSTCQVELEVKKINREFSTALIELYVSKLKWDFARCYLSSKTSFILGDVRFSKRIREILGKPIQVSAFKSSHRFDNNYEPLNSKLRNFLGVYKNSSIPLMLDLHALRLKGFDRKQKSRDLFIQSPCMPVHFALTAQSLSLLDS